MTGDRAGDGPSLDGTLRLLVCDLDGTLLEADGSISERTRTAVSTQSTDRSRSVPADSIIRARVWSLLPPKSG